MRCLVLLTLLAAGAASCVSHQQVSRLQLSRPRLVVSCSGQAVSEVVMRPGFNTFIIPEHCKDIDIGVEQ